MNEIRVLLPDAFAMRGGSTMIQEDLRVGIVGTDAETGWARVSHVPAINGLPGLKLAAAATRNEQSAGEAAEAFGGDRWFSDPFTMIRDARIDIITVAVKVPEHRELILAALRGERPKITERHP